jgi:hypothetical protein
MEELILINKYLTVNTLERYLEKYPEDVEKWLGHLIPDYNNGPPPHVRRRPQLISEEDIEKYHIVRDMDTPFLNPGEMCGLCRKTWDATSLHATTTLLCGHKYHTVCYFLHYYEYHDGCVVDGCASETSAIINQLSRRRTHIREGVETALINTVKNNKDFKLDIKNLKRSIYMITKRLSECGKYRNKLRKDVIKKHECNLTQLQHDLNRAYKISSSGDIYNAYKSEIRKYRKIESSIYRKYHLNMHDLGRFGIMPRYNWRIRTALNRHNRYSNKYRFVVRVSPGRRNWFARRAEDSEEGEDDDEAEEAEEAEDGDEAEEAEEI